jgi:hypothetical protein
LFDARDARATRRRARDDARDDETRHRAELRAELRDRAAPKTRAGRAAIGARERPYPLARD